MAILPSVPYFLYKIAHFIWRKAKVFLYLHSVFITTVITESNHFHYETNYRKE